MRSGLPHSEIHGSKGARPSPQLFAACHVLHRLLAPRHPPDALFNASLLCRIAPALFSFYPCPENEPEAHHLSSIIRAKSVVLDQCRIHMSHGLPRDHRHPRIGMRKRKLMPLLAPTEAKARRIQSRDIREPSAPIDDLHRLSPRQASMPTQILPPQCQ